MSIIKTKNLTKFYGKVRGIEHLDLEVKEGEIYGFLGPNGAGKTTTIRTILHLIKPTKGEMSIFGTPMNDQTYPDLLQDIGHLSGEVNLYENMTGDELLKFATTFYKRDDFSKFKLELVDRLECDLTKKFKNLSSGNKQKIGILLALFHKPKLAVLDEPTASLDPLVQNEIYKILKELKREGMTIFFSSHNLPEVEKICDRIGIIRNGKLVDVETIEQLRGHRRKLVDVHFYDLFKKEDFTSIDGIEIIDEGKDYLQMYAKSDSINDLLQVLAKYKVKDLNFTYPDLEQVFLKYYEE